MDAQEAQRVVLELDAGSDGLEGWLIDPGGDRRRFSGWLDLASGLENVRRQGIDRVDPEHGPAADPRSRP